MRQSAIDHWLDRCYRAAPVTTAMLVGIFGFGGFVALIVVGSLIAK